MTPSGGIPRTDFQWTLRPAAPSDLEAFRKLLREVNLPDADLASQFGDRYLVAIAGGRIVAGGGVETWGGSGLLRSIAVSREYQGSGVGTALVRALIERARGAGLVELYLLTETAAGFFTRFGFVAVDRGSVQGEIRRSTEFSSCCPTSATVMRIALTGRGTG